ncbi:MAG: OmpH family outer membrane protein [Pseudomonadota bacterium]
MTHAMPLRALFSALPGARAALFGLAALVAAGAAAPTPALAQADGPVILIVNQQALLVNSKAGKDIARQMGDLQKVVNNEIRTEVESISKEGENLQTQKDLLSEEVLRERARSLALRERNFPALRELKIRELELTEQKALAEIGKVLQPILQDMVNERGATLLLDRSAVMFASADNDVTQQVMAALDKKIDSVKVERVEIKRGEEGAAAAEEDGKKKRRRKKKN